MPDGERVIRGSIDSPTLGTEVPADLVEFKGWVFDEEEPLDAAVLITGDRPGLHVSLGTHRPDVGEAYPTVPGAAASGFSATVDLRWAAAGNVAVTLLARSSDGVWREAASTAVACSPSRARRSDGRRRAVFTIVQNEPVWLPIWLDYYGRYFDRRDIFVLDHDSTDESTAGLEMRCTVVPVHRAGSFDHNWLRGTVEAFQTLLLRSYETVLFAEADEFIVADPRQHAGLDAYIDALDTPAVRCSGFNVVHQPEEAPLRFDEPLLSQRHYWHASLRYSKRLLSKVPLSWSLGFHEEHSGRDDPPDPSLILIHLHQIDYDFCLAHHRDTASRVWSEAEVASGNGYQNRIVDPKAFEAWFRGPWLESPRELIPQHIRSVL